MCVATEKGVRKDIEGRDRRERGKKRRKREREKENTTVLRH
jgi:hypothetical protein